jgi:hypothetical protein
LILPLPFAKIPLWNLSNTRWFYLSREGSEVLDVVYI